MTTDASPPPHPVPDLSPQSQNDLVVPEVETDVQHVAFCLAHESGLTEPELTELEAGDGPCVFALRLDDLDAAGVALMPSGTPAYVKTLRERLVDMDAQYQTVLEDIGDLGVALGHPKTARPESPQTFLRMCVDEVRSLRRGDR